MTEEVDNVGTRVGSVVCGPDGDGNVVVLKDVPDRGLVDTEKVGEESVVKEVCGLLGVV